jgi:hypothetical protein
MPYLAAAASSRMYRVSPIRLMRMRSERMMASWSFGGSSGSTRFGRLRFGGLSLNCNRPLSSALRNPSSISRFTAVRTGVKLTL